MIGAAYRSAVVQAVLGPARSSLIPSRLHIGWLDSTGELIAMSGLSVASSGFTAAGDGVANVSAIDAGIAGSGWTIAAIALFDAPTDGQVVLSASTPAPVTPAAGESLTIPAGGLVFTAVDA